MGRYVITHLELAQSNRLVAQLHRHHRPVRGHRFSLGLADNCGRLVGCVIVGRPVSREVDQSTVAEALRVVTDGSPGACSALYGAAARAAAALGYARIQTYILASESGVSLKGAGWLNEGPAGGRQWVRADGAKRRTDQPTGPKLRWAKQLRPV